MLANLVQATHPPRLDSASRDEVVVPQTPHGPGVSCDPAIISLPPATSLVKGVSVGEVDRWELTKTTWHNKCSRLAGPLRPPRWDSQASRRLSSSHVASQPASQPASTSIASRRCSPSIISQSRTNSPPPPPPTSSQPSVCRCNLPPSLSPRQAGPGQTVRCRGHPSNRENKREPTSDTRPRDWPRELAPKPPGRALLLVAVEAVAPVLARWLLARCGHVLCAVCCAWFWRGRPLGSLGSWCAWCCGACVGRGARRERVLGAQGKSMLLLSEHAELSLFFCAVRPKCVHAPP